jgi:hypothetical protein
MTATPIHALIDDRSPTKSCAGRSPVAPKPIAAANLASLRAAEPPSDETAQTESAVGSVAGTSYVSNLAQADRHLGNGILRHADSEPHSAPGGRKPLKWLPQTGLGPANAL